MFTNKKVIENFVVLDRSALSYLFYGFPTKKDTDGDHGQKQAQEKPDPVALAEAFSSCRCNKRDAKQH
jgi:hypothetical protein